MEKRDLYDRNKKLTGVIIDKNDDIPKGNYILIVKIFIQDKNGKFLIQKRSEGIYGAGLWATTSGHPKAGESSLEGVCTEVKEELGIDISRENINLIDTSFEENIISDIYHVIMDVHLEDIKIDAREVSEVKLADVSEIMSMIESDNFLNFHIAPFKICMQNLEKNKKLLK